MKKKTWKRCVCMIGVVLFAVTGLNANNRVPDSPIKKTRSNTFIIEKEKAWNCNICFNYRLGKSKMKRKA